MTYLLDGLIEKAAGVLGLDLLLNPPVRYVTSVSSIGPVVPVRILTMRPSLAKTMDPESPASENLPRVLS